MKTNLFNNQRHHDYYVQRSFLQERFEQLWKAIATLNGYGDPVIARTFMLRGDRQQRYLFRYRLTAQTRKAASAGNPTGEPGCWRSV